MNGVMRDAGRILRQDGTAQTFFDKNLLPPYLAAFEAKRRLTSDCRSSKKRVCCVSRYVESIQNFVTSLSGARPSWPVIFSICALWLNLGLRQPPARCTPRRCRRCPAPADLLLAIIDDASVDRQNVADQRIQFTQTHDRQAGAIRALPCSYIPMAFPKSLSLHDDVRSLT
jgi:hypothetical protein